MMAGFICLTFLELYKYNSYIGKNKCIVLAVYKHFVT